MLQFYRYYKSATLFIHGREIMKWLSDFILILTYFASNNLASLFIILFCMFILFDSTQWSVTANAERRFLITLHR